MNKKRFIKCAIALVLALIFACNALSCKRLPKTIVSETDTYYSYSNVNYGNHERHYLDLFIPKGEGISQGMILYIHGGGWIGGDKEVHLEALKSNADRGYISAAINYRYADGKKVLCEDILDDIDAALGEIKNICNSRGVKVDRVMLAGGSAGGHLSLMYAYARAETAPIRPVAVASYAGPTNLYDGNFYITSYVEDIKKMISKISGADIVNGNIADYQDVLMLASPISYVDENTVPTLLCHGTVDDVVPYSNATKLYQLLCEYGVDCELITFKNSGHGLESDPDAWEYSDRRFYEFAEKYVR